MNPSLTQAQRHALRYVEEDAAAKIPEVEAALQPLLAFSNITKTELQAALLHLQEKARVCVHFHPDRRAGNNMTVIESLQQSGFYQNQFVSLLSNGKLDPHAQGLRAQWEDRLFGQAFTSVPLHERPKYGALDLMEAADGAAPRFGSCYLLLKPHVTSQATFCFGDSHVNPTARGTIHCFLPVLAKLLEDCFLRDMALGTFPMRPKALLHRWQEAPQALSERVLTPPSHNLDHYIEAQIHSEIALAKDVEALVADASFQGTPVERAITEVCNTFGFALYWRPGFSLSVDKVPSDFRGPEMPALAKDIAHQGRVSAYAIGVAAQRLTHSKDPQALQALKFLWHVLVKYG